MSRYARSFATTNTAAGAILLEVVLALTLFVSAAAVIGAGLNQCLDSAYRLEVRTRAADLAVTCMSEIELGQIAAVNTPATPYEDERLAGWTWQVVVDPVEDVPGMDRLELTVNHEPTGVYHRLVRWITP